MSLLKDPPKGLLFTSVIYHNSYSIDEFWNAWQTKYGEGELFVPTFNPSFNYYSKEMGPELNRAIFFSHSLQNREELVAAKLWATAWEQAHIFKQARTINIDPGLLNLENMVLATGKPFAHRIYLGQGIYADLNYIYQKGGYQTLPWTYPDYAHSEKLTKFQQIRENFLFN